MSTRLPKARNSSAYELRRKRARELKRKGLTNKEIAERMRMSPSTIRQYTNGMSRNRVNDEEWVGPLPELDDDDRPYLEDYLRRGTMLGMAQDLRPDLDGLGAERRDMQRRARKEAEA